MLLIQALPLVLSLVAAPTDTVAVARRIAASASLAAAEYRIGVVDGKVVAPAEVDEATLFLTEAKRAAAQLPAPVAASAVAELERALGFVAATALPDSVDAAVRRVTAGLTSGLGISLVEFPKRTPSLARGAELYARECAACHGELGRGDGPAGRGLEPAPANLADHAALRDVTPLAFYQRITIGVAGTAMPAYETRLPVEDRWALALYATTLRQEKPAGQVPDSLQVFATVAELNDEQLLAVLGPNATRAEVAAVRAFQPSDDPQALAAAVFGTVRGKIDDAVRLAGEGQAPAATSAALDAYLEFEAVERDVRTKDAGLAGELEAGFAALRDAVSTGATIRDVEAARSTLLASLERAERTLGDVASPLNLFVQSLMILVREGLEAILIIGAIIAFLVKIGAGDRRRDIHLGVGAAVVLSIVTAVLLETVFRLSPAHQEVLEGWTMIAAVGVLFYVSYWLLAKMEVQKWTAYVKDRVQEAVPGGSVFALASAAFLAVYREGFETVLFYKALVVSAGSTPGALAPIVAGVVVGSILMAIIYLLINRYGVRLPLKPFFAVTSAFLYYTAFVFAGKAVAELQAGGALPLTPLAGWPRLAMMGIYPTLESMVAQGVLLALAALAMGYIWLVQRPREARRYAAMVVSQG
jgi:high-affinity iron transporter